MDLIIGALVLFAAGIAGFILGTKGLISGRKLSSTDISNIRYKYIRKLLGAGLLFGASLYLLFLYFRE